MATAENLGRDKHHFNLVKITTIPSVTAKPFSEITWGLRLLLLHTQLLILSLWSQSWHIYSVRHYENIIRQHGGNEATVCNCSYITLINDDFVECEGNSGLLLVAGTKAFQLVQ